MVVAIAEKAKASRDGANRLSQFDFRVCAHPQHDFVGCRFELLVCIFQRKLGFARARETIARNLILPKPCARLKQKIHFC